MPEVPQRQWARCRRDCGRSECSGTSTFRLSYLRASEAQRRALLAGLLDTDGTVTAGGAVQFSVTNQRLASDVTRTDRQPRLSLPDDDQAREGPHRGVLDRVHAELSRPMTRSSVSRERPLLHKERRAALRTARSGSRFIVDVRPIESVPVRCVEVDNADHMYLAGRAMVPTHNSTLGLDFLRSCSIKHRMSSVIFSLEMSKSEIVMRLLSAEAKIKLADMRSGRMSDDDWTRLARRMSEISEAPLYIDDSPNLTMMEIRAKARRLNRSTT